MRKIWIVTGTSESGDDFGPVPWEHKPTDRELSEWCHNCDGNFGEPEDYEDGPGDYGSYVYVTVTEREISD